MTVADTTPYPWPFDGALRPERAALVVCGAGPEWAVRCRPDPSIEDNIEHLRDVSAEVGALVVLVAHRRSRPRRPLGLPSAGLRALMARPGEETVFAAGIDGFYGSDLDAIIHDAGRDQLLITGRGLETAIHSTLRRANDRGYECLTVVDACAALDESLRAAAVSMIEMSGGIFGAVGTTPAVVDALVDGTPKADADPPDV